MTTETSGGLVRGTTVAEQAESIRDIHLTSFPHSAVLENTGLVSTRLGGKRVLDLASGLSDFVQHVNEQGGAAVGVDICYANIASTVSKGLEFMAEELPRAYASSVSPLQLMLDKAKKSSEGYKSVYTPVSEAMSRCLQDFLAHPERYIGANILALPFEDGTFDLVTCNSFLTSLGGPESQKFTDAAILEALRVTRRGGDLRVGPIFARKKQDRVIEDRIRSAAEVAKGEKLASKLAKRTNSGGVGWFEIERSRKR